MDNDDIRAIRREEWGLRAQIFADKLNAMIGDETQYSIIVRVNRGFRDLLYGTKASPLHQGGLPAELWKHIFWAHCGVTDQCELAKRMWRDSRHSASALTHTA